MHIDIIVDMKEIKRNQDCKTNNSLQPPNNALILEIHLINMSL
jgi:hypothetical protein